MPKNHQAYLEQHQVKREAQKLKQREHMRKFRAKRLEYYRLLKRKPCARCGGAFHPAAMDFHHRDPRWKTAQVSEIVFGGLKTLHAEIEKCDLLCANCHRTPPETHDER